VSYNQKLGVFTQQPTNTKMKNILNTIFACILALFISGCDGPDGPSGRLGPLSPPLGASSRDSLVGNGKVLIVMNKSNGILYDISVHIKAADGHEVRNKITEVLKPAETVEIGWMELTNWKLEPGEEIHIYAKGYPAPYNCTIPK